MNYKPLFLPVVNGKAIEKHRDASAVVYDTIQGGEVTSAQALSFVSGSNSLVARGALANTVQPSAAQLAALLLYLAAIQAGTNTGSVETAILAL